MSYHHLSDKAILSELGSRLKVLRLQKDLTQEQVSKACLISLNAIKAMEAGKAKLSTIVAVLRELGELDQLDAFIPPVTISPIQVARMKGKIRQRASRTSKPDQTDSSSEDQGEKW